MASSKSLLLLLCALFAIVLIVSSQVAASADHTKHSKETTGLEEGKYGGPGNGYPGGGYEGRGGYSGRGGYPGRECRYRCDCRGYHYAQGCQRCCANANETPDAQFEHDHPN